MGADEDDDARRKAESVAMGDRIRKLRLARKMPDGKPMGLRELGRAANLSAGQMSKLETGERHPDTVAGLTLAKLAETLEVPTEYLRTGSTSPSIASLQAMGRNGVGAALVFGGAPAPEPPQPTVERGLRHEALEALVARERFRWSHGAVEEARTLRFALKDQPSEAAWAKILDDIERRAKAAAKGKVVHQRVTSGGEADAPELRDALEELDGKLEHAGLDLLDRQAWAAKLRERWTEDADAYELVKALVAEATKKPAKKKAKR
jgi:transcriptional regulator with XRE-family HTH domain